MLGADFKPVTPVDDRALATRCADGDPSGWEELLARFERRATLVLLRAGVAEPELADLRQDVYARLLADRGAALRGLRAEREGALGAFVAQVALRVAIDHGRARGTRVKSEVDLEEAHRLPTLHRSPEDEAARTQRHERFSRALLAAAEGPQLERDLTVLRAHFADGLNPQEIAGMGVGLSAKGVETLLRRARLHIEESLGASAQVREVKEK